MEDFILKEQLSAVNDLYVSKRSVYIKQKRDGSYSHSSSFKYNTKLTDDIILSHLSNDETIGIMCADTCSKFITFDVDAEGYTKEQRKAIVRGIIREIVKLGIDRRFIYIIDSTNKGYHVVIYFNDMVYLSYLYKFYEHILISCGYNNVLVEFRPTPTIGLRLPLSIHRKTGKVSYFLDDNFFEIRDRLFITKVNKFDRDLFNDIVNDLVVDKEKEETIHTISDEFKPNKLQLLSVNDAEILEEEGIKYESTRNYCMVQLAVLNNTRGIDRATALQNLNDWISKQNKELFNTPLTRCYVENKKIINWVYNNNIKHSVKQNLLIKISNTEMTVIDRIENVRTRNVMFAMLCHSKRFKEKDLYMSYTQISYHSGVNRKYIRACLDELITYGYIKEVSKGVYKQSNLYDVTFVNIGSRVSVKINYKQYDLPYISNVINYSINKWTRI